MRFLISLILGLFLITAVHAADFTLKSPGFFNNSRIPQEYTCDGKNISPALNWINPPANTQSFVLILSCPDAPGGLFYNWVLYNIPSDTKGLVEGGNENLPDGTLTGNNSMGDALYRGPCPPDSLIHHYVFTLYALNTVLNLPAYPEAEEVIAKLRRHIIKEAKLTGIFSH